MRASWNKTPVRDISTRITKGTTPTTGGGSFAESGIAFIKVESISEAGNILAEKLAYIDEVTNQILSRSIIQKDDVLFTIAGTIGRTALIREEHLPANTNQAVAIVRPDQQKVLPRFLYYALSDRSKTRQAESRTVQSVQANFSLGELGALEVELPSLTEQGEIASILGALDDKIELNRRMNGTLEALAQAVFKEWFVEKAEEGWETMKIEDALSITKGVSYKSAELADSEVALVTLKSINRGGGYRTDGLKPYVGKYKPTQVITPGELVVAQTDVTQGAEVIGKPALVLADERQKTLVASLDLLILRPKLEHLDQHFFYLRFRTEDFQNHIYGYTSGTTVLHLSKQGVPSYEFKAPPAELGKRFTEQVKPLFDRIALNVAESRTLTALRDTLLPKLMRGEVRVREAATIKALTTP